MPFGAEVGEEGTAFRLWAAAAHHVDVVVGQGESSRAWPLSATDDGWHAAAIVGAGPGTRYAFRIEGGLVVPDPASRANPDGVHRASEVVDPGAYAWRDAGWQGRPWSDAVVYELHVGTFTRDGTFAAARKRLDYLVDLGVTAIELMPVAAFAGERGWGYDGVLPFAPAACYGSPASMKQLIDEAHARGLMVLLDVVYNHFGPEGNYLHAYAPQFFSRHHETPWGAAINFDGDRSATVRDFFIHNALYWLGEFHLDGLRLDAVHAIIDRSHPDFVTELAARVARAFDDRRRVHLVLENDLNQSRYLRRDAEGRPLVTTSQWNDDFHHALHVLAAGETDGYYADYAERPLYALGRALAEGFVFQGESSAYRGGERRGEPSSDLPPTAFVAFAQNHDQVGNRAFGERLATVAPAERLKALVACMLLSPQVPLLFMGEEFGATTPFLYFCDFGPELAAAVTEGRREEFARFERFHDPAIRERIPDPNARATFEASKLAWNDATAPVAAGWIAFYRECLSARRRFVVPLMTALTRGGSFDVDDGLLRVDWAAADGRGLALVVNLGAARPDVRIEPGALVYASAGVPHPGATGTFPANGVLVSMRAAAT